MSHTCNSNVRTTHSLTDDGLRGLTLIFWRLFLLHSNISLLTNTIWTHISTLFSSNLFAFADGWIHYPHTRLHPDTVQALAPTVLITVLLHVGKENVKFHLNSYHDLCPFWPKVPSQRKWSFWSKFPSFFPNLAWNESCTVHTCVIRSSSQFASRGQEA